MFCQYVHVKSFFKKKKKEFKTALMTSSILLLLATSIHAVTGLTNIDSSTLEEAYSESVNELCDF